jgi:D-amino-acid oxidase
MDRGYSRRAFLRSGGLAAAGAFAHACAARGLRTVEPVRRFAKVRVSDDRVIRTVVGLRPFRPAGFRVEAAKLDGKIIVHNYGHGGGGMTMSWGTANLAVEQAPAIGPSDAVAVIGCGGVGLATARLLQRRGAAVTIYAKDLPPNTTSNIAGAQWSPAESYDTDAVAPGFMDRFARAARLSHREFQNLVGDYYGVRWIENYYVADRPPRNRRQGSSAHIEDLYPDSRELGPREHPFPGSYVSRFVTMLIEPPIYLNAVLRDFLLAGGKLVVREFPDLAAVAALPEPLVMNCTGLGAKALVGDTDVMPIKGQLTILLPQAEVDYITLTDRLYMFPRRDGVLLGGTHERNEWSLEPNAKAMREILDGHARFFAQMR